VVDDAAFEAKSRGRTVQIVGSCDAIVAGDPELLRSAVENVVRNAIRHTRDGTCVEVTLARDGPGRVRIGVRDHGAGVPESALPYIFQPFYRVGDARDRGTGGVGLGLTIVDRTIRLHEGMVRAMNAPGGGLIVELTLPTQPG
jgi:two-component system sensor histidine kinase CpxA